MKNISTRDLLSKAIKTLQIYDMVTVRQVYYVLVSQQTINNNLNEYRRVVRILKKGRLAGLINFDNIIDDTREAEKSPTWKSLYEIITAGIDQYRSDWWRDQPRYLEVWLEKRALRRIFYPITNSYDVYLCTGGGYQSWSEVWEARKRFYKKMGGNLDILYFGDLDPSGKDMPRDIHDRFQTLGFNINLIEIALTKEDIKKYGLPRNPSKKKDSRQDWYTKKYGINYAVELDALPPKVLRDKIRQSIEDHCNLDNLYSNQIRDIGEKTIWRNEIMRLKEKLPGI